VTALLGDLRRQLGRGLGSEDLVSFQPIELGDRGNPASAPPRAVLAAHQIHCLRTA
jgi:hypothetical protein